MPPTVSERARKRATESRLRAIYHAQAYNRAGEITAAYYTVYNLRDHRKYTVGYNDSLGRWVCHCEAAKAQSRCKHVQRVLDREEKRIRAEALTNG